MSLIFSCKVLFVFRLFNDLFDDAQFLGFWGVIPRLTGNANKAKSLS